MDLAWFVCEVPFPAIVLAYVAIRLACFACSAMLADGGREAILKNAAGLAKTMGASAPALLAVIQDPPKVGATGSIPFMQHVGWRMACALHACN